MTTQTSYSDNKNLDLNINSKFFIGELRRSWPKMVLYFIIFALTMILPLLMQDMGMMNYSLTMTEEENILRNSARLLDLITEYIQIWAPVSMVVALFAGCYVTKMLNNRVSADFFHSIPMSRESMYITRLLVGIITYLATFILAVLAVLILCETQTLADGYGWLIFKQIIRNFGFAFLTFSMIYSTTVFAGMLCGSTPMQLIMTIYLNIILFVYYGSFFSTIDLFFENLYTSYYLEENIITRLLPFVRFMDTDLINEISIPDICFYAIGSLLLLMGAMALYRFRKIEKAGSPIVFDGFAAFFRYSVIIPVTLLGGLFFNLMVGSFIWYIIGLVIGAFLCFLLVNTILAKNARKMFSGIKGFAIYSAVMLVIFCMLGFDIFGIDDYIPSWGEVSYVEVTLNNQLREIAFKDENVIKSAIALDKSKYSESDVSATHDTISYIVEGKYEGVGEYEGAYFYTSSYDSYSYRVVYKLKSGIPLARKGRVYLSNEALRDLCRAVADSEEYESYWKESIEAEGYSDYYISGDRISEANTKDFDLGTFEIEKYDAINSIAQSFDGIDYTYFQRQQIGNLNFQGSGSNGYKSFDMPIYTDSAIAPILMRNMNEEEYYDYLVSKVAYIIIYKGNDDYFTEENGIKLEEDAELYKEVLKDLSNLSYDKNIFTETEPLYHVGIAFYSSDSGSTDNVLTLTGNFLEGKVPAKIQTLIP